MDFLTKLNRGVTLVNKKAFQVGMWLIYPLVAVVMYEVVRRYLFNNPTNWVYDMTWIIFGAFVFLGFGYTLAEGGHVKADIILEILPPIGRKLFVIVGYLAFFFPMMLTLTYSCWISMVRSIASNEQSMNTSWAPIVWPCKIIITIACILLTLQGTSEFLLEVKALFTKEPAQKKITDGGETA